MKTGRAPVGRCEIVEAAAGLGLDMESLRRALAVKSGQLTPDANGLNPWSSCTIRALCWVLSAIRRA